MTMFNGYRINLVSIEGKDYGICLATAANPDETFGSVEDALSFLKDHLKRSRGIELKMPWSYERYGNLSDEKDDGAFTAKLCKSYKGYEEGVLHVEMSFVSEHKLLDDEINAFLSKQKKEE